MIAVWAFSPVRQVFGIAAAGLAATLLAWGSAAGPLADGTAAFERSDYATAVNLWRPLAEQGNAPAQAKLGMAYAIGGGVPRDSALAVQWFRKAADQGDPDGEYGLGALYDGGQGVPEDDALAAKWRRKAADQGLAAAQYSLGMMYAYGQGGLRRDLVQAYLWLNIAASRYPPTQAATRAKALAARDAFAAEMSGGQIAKARKLSGAWVRK